MCTGGLVGCAGSSSNFNDVSVSDLYIKDRAINMYTSYGRSTIALRTIGGIIGNSNKFTGKDITVDNANTYQTVVNHMESDSSGKYIGNLMGANGDDKALLTALFEGALTFNVGNEEVPITVMIKEKNVYGNSQSEKEMVLYITADDLGTRFGSAPVYAAVFTKTAAGTWEQIGDIFVGKASINGYSGSWLGTGSFNTESWESIEVYYGVAAGSEIGAVITGYTSKNPN